MLVSAIAWTRASEGRVTPKGASFGPLRRLGRVLPPLLASEFMHSLDHPVDRRRWERVPVELQVKLFAVSEPLELRATAVELSWNGVRIRGSGFALKPGDALEVVLMSDKAWEKRSARVVWVDESKAAQGIEAGLELRRWAGSP